MRVRVALVALLVAPWALVACGEDDSGPDDCPTSAEELADFEDELVESGRLPEGHGADILVSCGEEP